MLDTYWVSPNLPYASVQSQERVRQQGPALPLIRLGIKKQAKEYEHACPIHSILLLVHSLPMVLHKARRKGQQQGAAVPLASGSKPRSMSSCMRHARHPLLVHSLPMLLHRARGSRPSAVYSKSAKKIVLLGCKVHAKRHALVHTPHIWCLAVAIPIAG